MCESIGITLNQPWPFIYRVWRFVSIRSRNSNKSRVKIQLLTRIGCFGPVWSVRPGCRSFGRHNFLIRILNWTFYICISIVSTRSMQRCSPIRDLTTLSWPVWPVYATGRAQIVQQTLTLLILSVNTSSMHASAVPTDRTGTGQKSFIFLAGRMNGG